MLPRHAQLPVSLHAALLLLWATSCSVVAAATQSVSLPTIVLVSSTDTHDSEYGRWLQLIYQHAFARLGYRLDYQGVPGARARLQAEAGQVDGEIHRPYEYQQQTRSMVRVEESHFDVSYEAYVIRDDLHFANWQALGQSGLHIEYRRGAKRAEKALTQAEAPTRLSDVTSTEQGLRKLAKGRVDVFIEQPLVAQHQLEKLRTEGAEYLLIHSAGTVDTLPTYAYLNRRHAKLASQLASVLRAMKRDGLIEQYHQLARSTPSADATVTRP